MRPKNLQVFISKSKELLNEIEVITTTLSGDLKTLQLRKNEFRDKCIQFLKFSFNEKDYAEKFKDQFFEVSQNDIYLDLPKPTKTLIDIILKQFDLAKNLLSSFVNNCNFIDSVISEIPSGINEQGLFFKGQYYDAIFKLSHLIENAKSEIKLVDNYINEDLINFLQKNNYAKISIITSDKNTKEMKQLNLLLKSFNAQAQFAKLEIRANNNFHDRFIILDKKDAYHFGASLKQLGDKAFMFSKIQRQDLLTALINGFDTEWQNSTILFS